jgi:hypothetical protein
MPENLYYEYRDAGVDFKQTAQKILMQHALVLFLPKVIGDDNGHDDWDDEEVIMQLLWHACAEV